jgi:hypothetical protein
MDAVVGKNDAGDLFLTFVSWNYQQPKPLRAGSERRAAREKAEGVIRDVLYKNTPTFSESRQVRRKRERKGW